MLYMIVYNRCNRRDLGAVRKLRKHIGVLSWSEKGNFCLFLVLKRGT
jgi:hypothetical protein